MDQFAVIVALIVFSFINVGFWAFTVHKLVNKLMSRNFYEYQEGMAISKKKEKQKVTPKPEPAFVDFVPH